jgi:hypothetical protein
MQSTNEKRVDAPEAARHLGMSIHWLRDHTTRSKPIVPHYKLGRKVKYNIDELDAFFRAQRETRPSYERD